MIMVSMFKLDYDHLSLVLMYELLLVCLGGGICEISMILMS